MAQIWMSRYSWVLKWMSPLQKIGQRYPSRRTRRYGCPQAEQKPHYFRDPETSKFHPRQKARHEIWSAAHFATGYAAIRGGFRVRVRSSLWGDDEAGCAFRRTWSSDWSRRKWWRSQMPLVTSSLTSLGAGDRWSCSCFMPLPICTCTQFLESYSHSPSVWTCRRRKLY